jgi:sigma-B regulation protein RsbU (phosphoserine phosphatase)
MMKNSKKYMNKIINIIESTFDIKKLVREYLKLIKKTFNMEKTGIYFFDKENRCIHYYYICEKNRVKQKKIEENCDVSYFIEYYLNEVKDNDDTDFSLIERRDKIFGILEFKKREDIDIVLLKQFIKLIAVSMENLELYRNLKNESLLTKSLLNINMELSLSLDLNEILKNIAKTLKNIVYYDAIAIYIFDKREGNLNVLYFHGFPKKNYEKLKIKIGQGLVGLVAKTGKVYISKDISKEKIYVNARGKTRSEIVVPIMSGDKLIGILNLENNIIDFYSEKNIKILEAFASLASVAIERARLYRDKTEKNRLQKELEIAKQIQKKLLPKEFPSFKGYDIYGQSEPSEIVGGDYFDFLKTNDNTLYFIIADISGKGIPAAILVSLLKSAFLIIFDKKKKLSEKVSELNRYIYNNTEPQQFITAIVGKIENDRIKIVNCGHNYPLLIRKRKTNVFKKSNIILGVVPDMKFNSQTIVMKEGELLFLYTDGLYESLGVSKKELGLEGIKKLVKKFSSKSLKSLWKNIFNEVKKISSELSDDFTILMIRRK